MGLLGIDIVATFALSKLGHIGPAVPMVVPILVGISLVGVARTFSIRRTGSYETLGFKQMAGNYTQASGLYEIGYACVMIPLFILAQLSGGDQ